jgi:hypothetical protein
MMSDGLLRKLRDEYGEPPPRHENPPRRGQDKDKRGKARNGADDPDGGS